MANQPVWVTSLGSNSCRIDYPVAATLANLMDTVETWITAHGWAVYDASAGTSAKAYRALNLDGSTYKYIVLDYSASGYIKMKVYESWNSGTHAGTNLAFQSDGANYCQRVNLSAGATLYLYAQAAYLLSTNVISGVVGSSTGNAFCGCVEVTRDNPEDTVAAGYPCFGWVNGYFIFAPVYCFISPRLRDGTTGANAGSYNFVSTILGFSGFMGEAGSPASMYKYMPSFVNAWSAKNWALEMRVGKLMTDGGYTWSTSPEIKGRLLGLKLITKSTGTQGDAIQIKVDATGFPDPNGTLTDHWVLSEGVNGGRFAVVK